ncbi:MAG TPA: glycosyltransferase [Candidatus Aminicenantes bacterium]|nr:glycosyltransferase [Candidatus Aminicenantes bacterium]
MVVCAQRSFVADPAQRFVLKKMKLVVIVVNWNGGEKLTRCLDSLQAGLRGLDFACVVVDNASTDGSDAQIETRYPWVRLLRSAVNAGYGVGNNKALAYMHENNWNGDYVFFLNNDTELEESGFSSLVEFMDLHPDVAALTPVLVESDGSFQIGVGGRKFTWFQIFAHFFFLNRLPFLGHLGINLNQARFAHGKKVVDLDWISGTAMLTRSRMIGDDALFPPEYFMYFEDLVVSEKLSQWGRLVYHPGYRIRHHRRHHERNLEYYFHSLHQYLESRGFGPIKMRITRATIYFGLGLRRVMFGLLAAIKPSHKQSLNTITRQMTALRNHWCP